jgi:hypothetical protein
MMKFTTKECLYLLELIRDKELGGRSGYVTEPKEKEYIGQLQAKLSMLLELAGQMGR